MNIQILLSYTGIILYIYNYLRTKIVINYNIDIWLDDPRKRITANSIISDLVGQTTNLGYQNASKESKEHAHTKILVYGCLEAFQNGCQKFVMTSSKIYRKFK